MKTIYVTITGTDFCCGLDFFRRHDALILKKRTQKRNGTARPLPSIGKALAKWVMSPTVPRPVLGESYSAGRLYDKIGKKATARVGR